MGELIKNFIPLRGRTHIYSYICFSENSKIRLWTSSRLIAQIFQKNKTLLNETEHSQLVSMRNSTKQFANVTLS